MKLYRTQTDIKAIVVYQTLDKDSKGFSVYNSFLQYADNDGVIVIKQKTNILHE